MEYTGKELSDTCKLKVLKYLVVGTGRCGTVYAAKLLSSVGIPCTHESIFQYDGIEAALERMHRPLEISHIAKLASVIEESAGTKWFSSLDDMQNITAESSYMASPFIDHPALKDTTIIHLVRHPLDVINSFVVGFKYFNSFTVNTYNDFMYRYIPELRQRMSPIARCALYWVRWNQMIEKKAKDRKYFLYRVEQSPSKLFGFLGIEPHDYYKNEKSNEKLGLEKLYKRFDQIPVLVRDELVAAYNRYYGIPKLFV